MASAWGDSFGVAWGDSWGATSVVVEDTNGVAIPLRKRVRKLDLGVVKAEAATSIELTIRRPRSRVRIWSAAKARTSIKASASWPDVLYITLERTTARTKAALSLSFESILNLETTSQTRTQVLASLRPQAQREEADVLTVLRLIGEL